MNGNNAQPTSSMRIGYNFDTAETNDDPLTLDAETNFTTAIKNINVHNDIHPPKLERNTATVFYNIEGGVDDKQSTPSESKKALTIKREAYAQRNQYSSGDLEAYNDLLMESLYNIDNAHPGATEGDILAIKYTEKTNAKINRRSTLAHYQIPASNSELAYDKLNDNIKRTMNSLAAENLYDSSTIKHPGIIEGDEMALAIFSDKDA